MSIAISRCLRWVARRSEPSPGRAWSRLMWGVLLGGAILSSGVCRYMLRAGEGDLWVVLMLAPALTLGGIAVAYIVAKRNHAGTAKRWKTLVLSEGAAKVVLTYDGVGLESVHHRMVIKPEAVVGTIESAEAFSVVSKHWEIIIPKRLLSADATRRAREALMTKLGGLTAVARGQVLRIPVSM